MFQMKFKNETLIRVLLLKFMSIDVSIELVSETNLKFESTKKFWCTYIEKPMYARTIFEMNGIKMRCNIFTWQSLKGIKKLRTQKF